MISRAAGDAGREKNMSQNIIESSENLEPWNMFTSNLVTPKTEPDDSFEPEIVVPEKDAFSVYLTSSAEGQSSEFIIPKIEPVNPGSDEESSCKMDCSTFEPMPKRYIRKMNSTRGKWAEEDLKKAIEAVKKGTSVRKASQMFNIPRKTLDRRVKSGVDSKGPMGPSSSLGTVNEEKLVNYIMKMQKLGFVLTRSGVRSLAFNFAEYLELKHKFNKEKRKAGYDWLLLFMSRHPHLSVAKGGDFSCTSTCMLNKISVKQYFSLMRKILLEANLFNKPASLFTVDQVELHLSNTSKIPSVKGEAVIVLVCCNAEGRFIPPYIIMKGKKKIKEWEDDMPSGSAVKMSEKSSDIHTKIFFEWLKKHFCPRKPSGKVVLISDSHTLHYNNLEMFEFAEANDTILVCLPSYSSDYLQPLNHIVVKVLKKHFCDAAAIWCNKHPLQKLGRRQLGELLSECWQKATAPCNAISGFRKSGIYPLNEGAIPHYAFLTFDPVD